VEAVDQTDPASDVFQGEDDARDKRVAADRVVPNRQRLARPTEYDLVRGDEAREPQAMDVHVTLTADAAPGACDRVLAHAVALEGTAPRLAHSVRDHDRRSGRGIDLPVVMRLDDLGGIEELARELRELHQQ